MIIILAEAIAKTIAMLAKDGRYREVYIPDDLYRELREAVDERERLQEQLTAIHNRVVRWLDIRFLEFQTVFKGWEVRQHGKEVSSQNRSSTLHPKNLHPR